MEAGFGHLVLHETRFDAIDTGLGKCLEIVRIERVLFHPVLRGWYWADLVMRQIRIVFDLLVKVLFVHGLQECAKTNARKLHELGVFVVGRWRSKCDDFGLIITNDIFNSRFQNDLNLSHFPFLVQFDQLLDVGVHNENRIGTILLLDVNVVVEILAGAVDAFDTIESKGKLLHPKQHKHILIEFSVVL